MVSFHTQNIAVKMDFEVLSTLDINKALKRFSVFKGSFLADRVPILKVKKTQAFIINTAKNEKEGEHWTALLVEGNKCSFFDSFGYQLLNVKVLNSLKNINIIQYQYSNVPIQPIFSDNCGYYCIAFILSYLKGFSYSEFLNLFSNNANENNNICYKFIQNYI